MNDPIQTFASLYLRGCTLLEWSKRAGSEGDTHKELHRSNPRLGQSTYYIPSPPCYNPLHNQPYLSCNTEKQQYREGEESNRQANKDYPRFIEKNASSYYNAFILQI